MFFSKIKSFANKIFSSKTYILGILNKFVPTELGKIVEFELDKDEKNISIEFEKNNEKSIVHIQKYSLLYKANSAFVCFEKLEVKGHLGSYLKGLIKDKKIKINPKYYKIAKSLL